VRFARARTEGPLELEAHIALIGYYPIHVSPLLYNFPTHGQLSAAQGGPTTVGTARTSLVNSHMH
jgi:hypothetical protein